MKKGKKKQDSDSSSSSSSSDDSSESSSESSKSDSPSPKKSRKSVAKKKHSKQKKQARSSSSSSTSEDEKTVKKKLVSHESIKAKQKEVEHSKWDSPVEKIQDKKRKAETREASPHDKDNRRDNDRREHNRRGDRQKEIVRDRSRDDNRGRYNNDREFGNRHYNERRNDDRSRYNRNDRFHDRHNDRRDDRRNDDRRNDDRRNDDNRGRNDSRERSPVREHRSKQGFDRRRNNRRRSNSFDHSKASWGRDNPSKDNKDAKKDKEKPNFGLSGKLTEETNTYKGVVIKYSEPPEARKPKRRWRLYPFKGEKAMQTLYIHRESAYLIGRDRKVVDLAVDHPSCSKQHAALQYRLVTFTRDDGSTGKRVRPYLIDLDSANGTHINNKQIESRKYVELLERDVIKFGYSSREYVLLHENSKDEAMDDDVKVEDESAVKEEPED